MALEFNGEETASFVYVERKPSLQGRTSSAPPGQRSSLPTRIRKWDIPHWDVPAAFENPRLALEMLGQEAYEECVREYYAAIGDANVQQAQRQYWKWAIRKVVSMFETHVRGYAGGRFIAHGPELQQPEKLLADGLLMADLEYIMDRFQVRSDLRPLAVRAVRLKLKEIWG